MDKVLIPIGEAAAEMGVCINTARTMAQKGIIPARKFGRQYRIHREAFMEWLDKSYGYKRKKGQ